MKPESNPSLPIIMNSDRKTWKHVLFTMVAIPMGAAAGFLCVIVVNLLPTFFDKTSRTPDWHSFLQFDAWFAAAYGMPVGGVLLPLTYLLLFRGRTFNQFLQIVVWLMFWTVVTATLGSALLQSLILSPVAGFIIGIFHMSRKLPPDERPTVAKMVTTSIIILVVGVIMIPFYMIAGMFWGMHLIKRVEKQLNSPAVYESVATNLALYCQSASSLNMTDEVSGAMLPQPLPRLGTQPWAEIRPDSAFVEFGGGFYHYGYNLQLDTSTSNPQTNYWELYFHSENSPNILLTRFVLATSNHISLTTFVSNTLSEYSRRISIDPSNLQYHKGRIRFLLQYDLDGVRQACLDATNDLPENWWPRLTLALWDSSHGKFTEASKTFVEFVQETPSYSHYIYLAWFYQAMNRPDEAAAAIQKAIQYSIVDLPDDDANSECRGYTVGVSALHSGKYDIVIKLCDSLLPIRINGDYAKAGLSALRNAAETARNGKPEAFQPDGNILLFNPYENMNMDGLLGH